MNRLIATAAAAFSIIVLAGCTTPEPVPLDPQAQVPPPRGDD